MTGIEGSVWRGHAVTGGFEYFGCQCSSEVQGIANDDLVLYVVDAFGLLQRYALADGVQLTDTFLAFQATAMVRDGDDLIISDTEMNVHRVSAVTGDVLSTMISPITITAMFGDQCGADLADPFGVLDFSDVIAFLTAFASAEPAADLAPPFGAFDFSDIAAYLGVFGDGCP